MGATRPTTASAGLAIITIGMAGGIAPTPASAQTATPNVAALLLQSGEMPGFDPTGSPQTWTGAAQYVSQGLQETGKKASADLKGFTDAGLIATAWGNLSGPGGDSGANEVWYLKSSAAGAPSGIVALRQHCGKRTANRRLDPPHVQGGHSGRQGLHDFEQSGQCQRRLLRTRPLRLLRRRFSVVVLAGKPVGRRVGIEGGGEAHVRHVRLDRHRMGPSARRPFRSEHDGFEGAGGRPNTIEQGFCTFPS